jgi:hypothetical protein
VVPPPSPDAGTVVAGGASVGGLVAAAVGCDAVVAGVVAGGRVVRSGLVTGSVVAAVDPSVDGRFVVGLPADVTDEGKVTGPPPDPPHATTERATATPSAATRLHI